MNDKKQIEICENCKKRNNCNHRDMIHKDDCRVNNCDYYIEITSEEKQIEEMAKIIKDNAWENIKELEAVVCATELYNQNYQKIPEDSVVLSREEYEKGKQDYNYQIHRALVAEGRVDKASKETAREILLDLKPLLEGFVHTDTGENLYVYKCKQFDIEIEE